MKRFITVFMLVVCLLAGGASVEAKRQRKSSGPAGAIAMVNIQNGGKLYLMNNGKVKVTPESWDADGKYAKMNGAYVFTWGTGTYGDNVLSIIYGNLMYNIIGSYYDDEPFWSYLNDNGWNLAEATSFNASTKTLTYKTTSGRKTVKLLTVPVGNRRDVKWY